MKKIFLMLAVAGFLGAGIATPAIACEGKKCTMEHSGKDGSKNKKGKKNAKEESCHKTESSAEETKSCCKKKDKASQSEITKEKTKK